MATSSSWWHMNGMTTARLGLTANPAGTQASDAIVA